MNLRSLPLFISLIALGLMQGVPARADSISDNPILFVTMVPNPRDFGTLAATFGNHSANPDTAYRGGDLWIRYPDGTLKNLTSAAGYGNTGFQGANSIAVRDPAVHWDGTKAIFSMVVGAATQQYQVGTYRWQLYEISGLGVSDTPVITKVANQPTEYNNHSPVYGSDDSILFISDRPRDDTVLHTYPQRDEYESSPVNSGLWKLTPQGALTLLDHAPSGDFNPIIDSFGRVIMTRWDHLQRDQQNIGASLGAFNFASEASTTPLASALEVFPEARSLLDPDKKANVNLFTINQFFPWMLNQDGTELETLNHVGRQEIGNYAERSFNDDPNVQEFYGQYSTGANQNEFTIFLHIREFPNTPGTYIGTSCQEFGTHSAGQVLTITGAPGVNPDDMVVSYITHPETAGATDTPSGNHSGLYRDPLPLSNLKILVSHTANTRQDENIGSSGSPLSRYDFRLKLLSGGGQYAFGGPLLTSGISKSVSFWSPDSMISYSGPLWEMMPAEVRVRQRPTAHTAVLPAVETSVFTETGVDLSELKSYLRSQNLALIVSRNVTMRDRNDRQQPTNLRVTGTSTQTLPNGGKIYDISWMQIFQGDLIRGYDGDDGRRVIAQPMHSVGAGLNPSVPGAPAGAVKIGADGSVAAFVPAGRALSWQLTDPEGEAVVRERYWLTMQPGEVRVCASCHGINTADHLGRTEPTNAPQALKELLEAFKVGGFPPGDGDGGDGGGGGDGDDDGVYSLDVTGQPALKAKKSFTLSANGGAAEDQLKIRVKLNKMACAGEYSLAAGSTTRTVSGKFPKIAGANVVFSLFANGSTTAAETASIKLPGKRVKLTKKETKGRCKALLSSLK